MKKIKLESILRLLALILAVAFIWGLAHDRLSLRNWKYSPEYEGDSLEFIAWIKAASEGDFIPFVREGSHRLAAPYQADWADYPASEKFYICFLGCFAKTFGLFQACNFGVLFAQILAAISFYACCRVLKYQRNWSFVGAILFAFTYYSWYRGLGHLHLACSYTLPFAVLSSWLVLSSKRMRLGGRFAWICLATGLVMGMSAPYNLNIYGQLLCFSLLGQYLTDRRRENLKVGILSLALAVAGFLAINARTLVYQWEHGKNTLALARNYFEAELYALKPIEFIMPPITHHIEAMADIGAKYKSSAFVKGEMFSAYLGIVVFVAMLWIFAELFLTVLKRRNQPWQISPHGLQISWIVAYAIIGGVNCVLSLAGFQLFRATIRYSIFVSLIALLFMVARLSFFSRRWPAGLKFAVMAALLMVGLFDQVPRPTAPADIGRTERMTDSDQSFSAALEAKLPPAAMVFELPVMVFPEAPPIRGVSCYEMLRPFLYTKSLRLSYGAVRGRPREDWQWNIEKMPAQQMISQLEKYGFSAIYLNRKCFADQGEEQIKQLAAAGRNQLIEDDLHEQVCVVLHPAAQPELPPANVRALLQFKSGWVIKTQTPGENRMWESTENRQWASGDATMSFFSEEPQITAYTFKCVIGSVSTRRVSIEMNGKELWSGQIPAGAGGQVNFTVNAVKGANTVKFKTDEPASRSQDGLPLAFTVINLEVARVP